MDRSTAQTTPAPEPEAAQTDATETAAPTAPPSSDLDAAVAAFEGAKAARAAASTPATETEPAAGAEPAETQAEPAEPAAAEPVAETKAPESEPDVPNRAQLLRKAAEVARREREIAQAAAETKRTQRELEAQIQKFNEQIASVNNARANPVAFLKANGVDLRDIVPAYLEADKQLTPEQQAAKELQELKAWRAETEKREQERAAAEAKSREEQTLETAKAAITQQISGGGDRWELINTDGQHQLVIDTMIAYYQAHGEACSAEAAADHVERELESRALKLANAKKISAKLKPSTPVAALSTSNAARPTASGARTITNRSGSAPAAASRPLSDDEAEARAAALLRWK